MKSILFVTSNNYPNEGTCSNILNKIFFDGKLTDFYDITVLAEKGKINDKSDYYSEKIRIIKILIPSTISLSLNKKILEKKPILFFKCLCQKLLSKSIKLFVRDPSFDFIAYRSFLKQLNRIDTKKHYDFVVTISGKYHNTFAVNKYCHKNDVKYCFYQVDPFSTNKEFSHINRKFREKMEKAFYSNSCFVLTTPIIKREIENKNYDENKIIGVGFPLLINNITKNENHDIKSINACFAGKIYSGIRDPNYILKLFSLIKSKTNIYLHLIGIKSNEIKKNNCENIICHGIIPYNDCQKIIKECDFLVNIGNKMDNQLPSKLVEYISYGKPIINIIKNKNCPSISFLDNYPYKINIFEEEDINIGKQKVEGFIDKYYGKRVDYNYLRDKYFECTPEYLSSLLITLLKHS